MRIKYEVTYRGYESRPPGLVILVYAGDDGVMYTTDPHSKFSLLSHFVPCEEVSKYRLSQIEGDLREYSKRDYREECHTPKYPMTREQVLSLCADPEKHAAYLDEIMPESFKRQYNT